MAYQHDKSMGLFSSRCERLSGPQMLNLCTIACVSNCPACSLGLPHLMFTLTVRGYRRHCRTLIFIEQRSLLYFLSWIIEVLSNIGNWSLIWISQLKRFWGFNSLSRSLVEAWSKQMPLYILLEWIVSCLVVDSLCLRRYNPSNWTPYLITELVTIVLLCFYASP